jgi:hypothetical protein
MRADSYKQKPPNIRTFIEVNSIIAKKYWTVALSFGRSTVPELGVALHNKVK